ncbi:MAG: nickel-dependent lactate racemase [Negativicutes bacterium]|nr:nickel-dependent lactate racemase [Negativicutes bacterium]
MSTTTFEFPYGDEVVKLALPTRQILSDIRGSKAVAVTDVPAAVREALRNPIGCAPLAQTVKAGDQVAILVSDITRAYVKFDQFLAVLLDELNTAGVPDSDIFIVIALGAHRMNTDAEIVTICGADVCHRIKVVQHDTHDKDNLVYVGTTPRGVESYANKQVMAADKVILTGGIVYHLMSGFGGGRKAVMPGISGYDSIQANHRFCLNAVVGQGLNPNCGSGMVRENEMALDMADIAALVNPDFLLNAVFTPEGDFARFVAGHWLAAWEEGCREVERINGIPVDGQADLTIASAGGYPKDINLYQAIKPIDNAYMATKPGGVAIMFMECRDIMEPPEYSEWLSIKDPLQFELALRKQFTVPGYSAFRLTHIARQITLIGVSKPENAEFLRNAGIIPVTDYAAAMEIASQKLGRANYTINVMTQAASTVPLVRRAAKE